MAKAKPKAKAKPRAKKTAQTNKEEKAAPAVVTPPAPAVVTPPAPAVVTPPAPTPGTTLAPKVRVRMFRHGLGDCFLLTFDVGGAEKHMLIDCGTLGNKNSDVKIADIAEHVNATIGSANLAVVVATHEHQDHLSGFNGPMQDLKGRVDHVWLAWTENPLDKDAQAYAKNKQDLGEALAIVAEAAPASAVGQQVHDLLGFAGDTTLGTAKFAETVNDAMEFVRKGLGAKTSYHNPGDLIEEPWLPGFRFYVLGPPRSKDSLTDLGTHESSELYGVASGMRGAALLQVAAGKNAPMAPEEAAARELEVPFDLRFKQSGDEFKQTQYPDYFEQTEAWRTIEEDWLNLASDLALQMDSMTNNTSLAFAIERIADGKVLLFPADSQEGNWLSWHAPERSWSVPETSGGTRKVTAADLLARTVFYKVGHHGSHNATARGKGLELMHQDAELTAFIPVDRAVALTRSPKDSWQMPARPLYRRLLEKCQGRVARADIGWAAKATGTAANSTEKEFQDMATDAEWTQWGNAQAAASHVRVEKLYVEYELG
jgi:hypothetical protein